MKKVESKREVRFRAWNEIKGYYEPLGDCGNGPFLTLRGTFCRNGGDWFPTTIEQFTGLTDSLGHDIYEGDILEEIVHECCYGAGFRARGIVRAGPWSFRVEPINYQSLTQCVGDRITHWGMDVTRATVIGNVHENEDLLKT